jgi:hypothetical protein
MPYSADTMPDGPRHDADPFRRRLPVVEAAALLGITPDAVRARLRRGTLRKEQGPDGETLVVIEGSVADTTETVADTTALVESLLEQVAYLKETVDKRDEEIRRRDHLLAAALERIPAIESPPETREGPETASEPRSDTPTTPEQQEPLEPRSWLARFFFGP